MSASINASVSELSDRFARARHVRYESWNQSAITNTHSSESYLCSGTADSPPRSPISSPLSTSGHPATTASAIQGFCARPSNRAESASPRCASPPLLVSPALVAVLQRLFVFVFLQRTTSRDRRGKVTRHSQSDRKVPKVNTLEFHGAQKSNTGSKQTNRIETHRQLCSASS